MIDFTLKEREREGERERKQGKTKTINFYEINSFSREFYEIQ